MKQGYNVYHKDRGKYKLMPNYTTLSTTVQYSLNGAIFVLFQSILRQYDTIYYVQI